MAAFARIEPVIKTFKKTEDQVAAITKLNNFKHVMMYGGSRSGKTTIGCRQLIIRAHKASSRHLLCRLHFNHAKTALWHDTLPKVLGLCFDQQGGKYKAKWNKSDWYLEFKIGFNKTSQIWLGGVDDKERVEKILGNEYSTIYANECSQIAYPAIVVLRTRLAENSGLKLRFYYDCNPPSKKHWTYQEFIQGLIPGSHDKTGLDKTWILMNPDGNKDNLPPDYIEDLDNLPKRERARFKYGKFQTEVEGALWNDEMVSWANNMMAWNAEAGVDIGTVIKTIVAVDPATTANPGSDQCGIVVMSITDKGYGIVECDRTPKKSVRPKVWAAAVMQAYADYDCNYVVAESNQGGELVTEVLEKYQEEGQFAKIKLVHASKGKFARAEPASVLYEKGLIAHRRPLLELEEELTETVFAEEKASPNRLDALVWAATFLFNLSKKAQIG